MTSEIRVPYTDRIPGGHATPRFCRLRAPPSPGEKSERLSDPVIPDPPGYAPGCGESAKQPVKVGNTRK